MIDDLVWMRAACASGKARQLRLDARLSLQEVGTELDVAPPTVGRWEAAERFPRGTKAREYAEFLRRLEALCATA